MPFVAPFRPEREDTLKGEIVYKRLRELAPVAGGSYEARFTQSLTEKYAHQTSEATVVQFWARSWSELPPRLPYTTSLPFSLRDRTG